MCYNLFAFAGDVKFLSTEILEFWNESANRGTRFRRQAVILVANKTDLVRSRVVGPAGEERTAPSRVVTLLPPW